MDRLASANQALFISAAFFGFGLFRSWGALLSILLGNRGLSLGTMPLNEAFTWLQPVMFLLFFAMAHRIAPLYRNDAVLIGAPVCMTAGSILLCCAKQDSSMVLVALGLVLTAIGYCAMYLLWLELYGCLPPMSIVVAFAGSCIVNALLIAFAESAAGTQATIAILIATPVIVLTLYFLACRSVSETRLPESGAEKVAPYARLIVWLVIFSFALGAGHGLIGNSAHEGALFAGRAIPAVIVLAGMLLWANRVNLVMVYRSTLPFVIVGFVLALLWEQQSNLAYACLGFGSWTFYTVAFTIPCGAAYKTGRSPVGICALLMTVLVGMEGIGMQASVGAGSMAQASGIVFAIAIVVLLVAGTTVVFKEGDLAAQWNLIDYHPANASTEELSDSMCDELAKRHGLSPQETRVFELMAKGVSYQAVAEELFIAPGTVRAHAGHIYKKLGIHSRDELAELLKVDEAK